MHRIRLHRFVVAVAVILGMLLQGTWVLAGTTGQITGTLSDSASRKAIAGAKISAISPSQAASATTDSQGRFTFLSLAPDTYAIAVDVKGYQSSTLNGITVQADQTQTLALTAAPALQTIGRTQSRAASDVIKAGQTADVYSISAAQASAAAALGGGGSLNQAYSAIASVPGVFVPAGQQGWAQSVYVRGGNYTQLGYEYDGVPVQRAYDAYPSSTLSALGQQEVQVYTGSQPGSAQSSGLAGFVNQVIKTGTYPGTATAELGFGAPIFYHKGQIELGGSSPDRNFSYYLASAGYDQAYRYVDQFDGASTHDSYSGVPFGSLALNRVAGNPSPCATLVNVPVGCYHNGFGSGPNGYLWSPQTYGSIPLVGDRETVANLHFGIPHKKDGLKDDVQVLGSLSYLFLSFNDSYSAYGPGASSLANNGSLSYNGTTYQQCGSPGLANGAVCARSLFVPPGSGTYLNSSIYTGPTGGPLTAANLAQVNPYFYPGQPNGLPANGPISLTENGNDKINDAVYKIQYTHAMGANAFARLYGYSLYSDWLENDPNAGWNAQQIVPSDYILPTHTRGLGFTVADQLGNHLVNLTGGYSTATLSRWNNSFPGAGPVGVLVSSANPTAGCYATSGPGAVPVAAPCSGADNYGVNGNPASPALVANSPGGLIVPGDPAGGVPVASATCGGAPCEYLGVGSSLNGSYNNVSPHFANLTLSDTWNVTPALSLDLGLRYDSFRIDIPSATMPQGPNPAGTASAIGRTLFTNSYNQWNCFDSNTKQIVGAISAGVCPPGSALVAFSNNNPTSSWYGGFQPRVGATYKVDPLNVVRVAYGRFLQPSSTAYTFYNRAGADLAGYDVPKFYAFGFNTAAHAIPPQESFNFDASWEHQVKGSDVSWKLTPFVRNTHHEDIFVVLDPTTNFVSAIPALSANVKGVEFLLRKGDFSRNGFAGQLAYTYTYETAKYETLPGGATALDNINASVKIYNGYTSFCTSHSSDSRCGTPTNGVAAAPCYTGGGGGGTPDPACAAGSIANPYWNAPVQPLLDASASYFPYNQTFSTGFTAEGSSYNVPHVAALILNYRHDKWAVTPTLQFTAGGRYGSPTMGIGIDPASSTATRGCTPLPAGYTTVADPRYPYGAAGGAPYAAQNCTGFLTVTDPYTRKFDSPGQFTEPSELLANVGFTYDASRRLSLKLSAVNVFGTCFGGSKQPWTNAGPKIGCWYGAASGWQAGNFYNPGDRLTPQTMPYFPVTGTNASQQAYGTAVNPFQLYLTAQLKL